ncbi:MAG: hypothetical protein AAGG51_07300 [Cyanobacteria bacterium P01_G01_bin.54]
MTGCPNQRGTCQPVVWGGATEGMVGRRYVCIKQREFRLSEAIVFLKALKSRCQTRLSGVQPPDTSR